MSKKFTFAKITATPTLATWSHAYHAGSIAAVVSLRKKDPQEQETALHQIGKEVLNNLEAEYFTLEMKNLDTIKRAIMLAVEKIPHTLVVNLLFSVAINNVLYVFLYGAGKIMLQRAKQVGVLLESQEEENPSLLTASGFLEHDDIVVLETPKFEQVISSDTLFSHLRDGSLTAAVETLSPILQKTEEGEAAAVFFVFHDEEKMAATLSNQNPPQAEESQEHMLASQQDETPKSDHPKKLFLSHKKKLLLTIAIVIAIVFVASIFFTLQKQQEARTQALFTQVYTPAQKKFAEGKDLMDLNTSLARDDLNTAKSMLQSAQGKFSEKTPQRKQIDDLLSQIDTLLSQSAQINAIAPQKVDASQSTLLSAEIKNDSANYFTIDGTLVYFATTDAINSFDGTKIKKIITNSKDWTDLGGFATYLGNMYLLDKTSNQILKYVVAGTGFGKQSYFSGTNPDLSKATSITIDGSIWILGTDGSVQKYTRGKADNLTISGLDKQFNNPTRIFTNVDDSNFYVLDNGNSRIVVFDKNGTYKAQYQAEIIKNAKDFDVDEKNKKLFILSGGSVYEIDMK